MAQRDDQARRVLDLPREEAERFGHRYLGPEHVQLGLLAEGRSGVAWARRVRPSDAELLGSLGIDLDTVRHQTEQTFGVHAVGEATWRVTRRRWWRGARVVWTPLCGPPLVAKRALQLASEQAQALNDREVRPEHVLLGVCADARQPADMVRRSRRHRRIVAHVGLPEGYQGAAGPLLAVPGIDLVQVVASVTVELGGVHG